jgi:cell division transport system permease protein
MSQSGKASIKRGKPSYFMSILGVTLVLFFLGIIGWLVINANKLGNHFKESVEVRVFLRGDLNPKDSVALVGFIGGKPYVKSMEYVTKEAGKKRYMDDGGEDWSKVLNENPLPNAIYFRVKSQYVNPDTLLSIKKDIEQQTYVSDVAYPDALVGNLNKNIRKVSIGLLALVIIIFQKMNNTAIINNLFKAADNTIRLAMFSNRFLIKTMQMVGATRWFIARPLNVRAVINGAISGVIASALLYILVVLAEGQLEWLRTIHDSGMLLLLFFLLIVTGICITLFSTHRSVLKYLRMKLDDLY